ncbi:MAG: phosphate ABC transporter, permease protein PstA, partial [Verrucomicrobia bacterium]
MISEETLLRPANPTGKRWDRVIRSFFAGVTYLILFIAVLMFGKICWDGAPTLFTSKAPFINFSFLLDKNETLHVFDDAHGVKQQLPASEYMAYVKKHGAEKVYHHHSYSYSGGGIVGPIVGTLLLTVGAIIIALFFGVSAAIYLSEYAKDSPFIRLVRLAILNLAGVPSIVFGLFGF